MKNAGMRTKTTGVFPIDGRGGDVVGGYSTHSHYITGFIPRTRKISLLFIPHTHKIFFS